MTEKKTFPAAYKGVGRAVLKAQHSFVPDFITNARAEAIRKTKELWGLFFPLYGRGTTTFHKQGWPKFLSQLKAEIASSQAATLKN